MYNTLHVQLRRARWFSYVHTRFHLVSFGSLADWLGRVEKSVAIDKNRREEAINSLLESINLEEFGPAHHKRCIVWLPKPPPSDNLGRFPLRLNYAQIKRPDAIPDFSDLHITTLQTKKWLEARQLSLPPWLAAGKQAWSQQGSMPQAGSSKPPFDFEQARVFLSAEKVSKRHLSRPSEAQLQRILSPKFSSTPRDPIREAAKMVWPGTRPGPKGVAKNAK